METNYFNLKDKVIIITGGSGYLGKEMCRELELCGAHVIAIGRNLNHLKEIESIRIKTYACDLLDEKKLCKIVDNIYKEYGKIDGLINNANFAERETWNDLNLKKWEQGLAGSINIHFLCIKIVSKYLINCKSGSIVNIGSLFGFLAPDNRMYPEGVFGPAAHHAVSKAGLIQLTKYLAALWGINNIRVNCVSPGWFPKKSNTIPKRPDRTEYINLIKNKIPLNRIGVPKDLVGSIIFLLSDPSSYITGQNIIIDGGYSIW